MAAASLVGSAIGVILLIVTAYVLVSGAITVTQVVVNAQTDMTGVQERILGTSFSISTITTGGDSSLILVLNNTGREVIGPYEKMDIFGYETGPGMVRYQYNTSGLAGTWKNESITPNIIHTNLWDPYESLTVTIHPQSGTLQWVKVSTPNGISASRYRE